ncbi:MAG: hypothetical protein ABIF71_04895 [Planctomycetota bacterium]
MRMLKPEEFAILPWGWTPGAPGALREIKACGFNLAGFVAPKHLGAVRRAGLKCIVSDPGVHVDDATAALGASVINRRVRALVKRVGGHKAVYGFYLRDEPGASVYPGLGNWVAAFRTAAPKAQAYVNLFPNYASAAQMNVPTYAEYLESFVAKVKPSFISYDHYALMADGSLRSAYFPNLEAVRGAALRHGLPFWNIVLSNAHFHYADPSDAGFRFQLYTTLAYGGRGISYFTYFAPAIGNYRLAPIDQFGNKTPTWDMLRNVNLQLHALGPTCITLKNLNVFHHPEVPEGSSGMLSSRLLAELTGGNLLAGEFEGPAGDPFVLVVNKDLHKSTTFKAQFKTHGPILCINAYTGKREPWAGENNWLAAGQGMLLTVER